MAVAKKAVAVASTKQSVLDVYEQVMAEARAEFESELAQKEAEFKKIQAEQEAEWKKELARKKEEDTYQFNKEKRDREDRLEVELKTRKEAVAQREANVEARELAVDNAEKDIAVLQAQVVQIPSQLSQAEATGYAKGKAEAKKEFDHEIRITEAENQAEKKVLQHRIDSLQGQAGTLHNTIETLKHELAEANKRVSEIATNAVVSAGQSKVTVNASQGK